LERNNFSLNFPFIAHTARRIQVNPDPQPCVATPTLNVVFTYTCTFFCMQISCYVNKYQYQNVVSLLPVFMYITADLQTEKCTSIGKDGIKGRRCYTWLVE
jgi:hypothetical protein